MNLDNQLDLPAIQQIINVCLLTATEPLAVEQIALAFDNEVDNSLIEKIIFNLAHEYDKNGLELLRLNNGFRLRSKTIFQDYLNKIYKVRPQKYSRSIMEAIAIIAYKQPVTRSEIEEIRGVTLNGNAIQTLLERNWIEIVGYKSVPGKPELLGTTNKFLEDLGISSLQELPPLPIIDKDNYLGNDDFMQKFENSKETHG